MNKETYGTAQCCNCEAKFPATNLDIIPIKNSKSTKATTMCRNCYNHAIYTMGVGYIIVESKQEIEK